MKHVIIMGVIIFTEDGIVDSIEDNLEELSVIYIDNINLSKEFANQICSKNNVLYLNELRKVCKIGTYSMDSYTVHVEKKQTIIIPYNTESPDIFKKIKIKYTQWNFNIFLNYLNKYKKIYVALCLLIMIIFVYIYRDVKVNISSKEELLKNINF